MEISFKQQIGELIKSSQNILLVSHKNPDGDALGSILALKIVLEKMGKKVTAVTADAPNRIFNFLPHIEQIGREIEQSNDFCIRLDVSKNEIAKIGYKKDEEQKAVNIIITPREGSHFESGDVSVAPAKPSFDLIISVDTPNIERLGEIASPADIFFEIPLINIDHHPSNEKFGKLNLVELVATSTAEILVSLFESLSTKDAPLIDADVATCLLTGLIYDTSSFQNINTTPKSLTVAAQLVAAGAKQQEIVKNLYKTKSMETLKLWGLVLTKVREDKADKFLWSSVSKDEINKTGADEGALSGVVDELLKSAVDVDFVMLLSEREGYVHGSLRSITKGINVAVIAELFGGGGHEVAAAFRIDGDLAKKEQFILDKIIGFQNKNSLADQDSRNHNADEQKKPVVQEPSVKSEGIAKDERIRDIEQAASIDAEPVLEKAPLEQFISSSSDEKTQSGENIETASLGIENIGQTDSEETNGDVERVAEALKEDSRVKVDLSSGKNEDSESQERVKTKW